MTTVRVRCQSTRNPHSRRRARSSDNNRESVRDVAPLRQICAVIRRRAGALAARRRSVGRGGPVQGQRVVVALGKRCGDHRDDIERGDRQRERAEHREQGHAQIILGTLQATPCLVGRFSIHRSGPIPAFQLVCKDLQLLRQTLPSYSDRFGGQKACKDAVLFRVMPSDRQDRRILRRPSMILSSFINSPINLKPTGVS